MPWWLVPSRCRGSRQRRVRRSKRTCLSARPRTTCISGASVSAARPRATSRSEGSLQTARSRSTPTRSSGERLRRCTNEPRSPSVLTHHLHVMEAQLVLPLELRAESEDRRISVDDVEHVFHGVRVVGGDRWSGSCEVGDVRITVSITGSATVDAVESTDGHNLGDSPTMRAEWRSLPHRRAQPTGGWGPRSTARSTV